MRNRLACMAAIFMIMVLLQGIAFGSFAFAEEGESVMTELPETEITEPKETETPEEFDGEETDTPDAPETEEQEKPTVPETEGKPETPEKPKVTLLKTPKVTITNVLDTGKPKLSWKKVKGADQYVVYRALKSDGVYLEVGTTKTLEMIHSKAVPGTRYYYKVQAQSLKKPETNSKKSPPKARACDLQRPVCKVALNKKGKPVITWNTVRNAESYEIYRAFKSNGTYKKVGTVKGTKFTHSKAYYHKTYYYKVRAIDSEVAAAASAKSKSRSIYTINLTKKLVALTFDDGPGPYTKDIVNCLRKNDSRATFFVLGCNVEYYESTLKAMKAGGNEIGNHSYSHPMLYDLTASGIRSQVSRTDAAVKKITGTKPTLLRPPYGAVNSLVVNNVGKPMIMWNIDTRDWEHRDADTTVRIVMNQASDGDIILMHDIHEPTMRAALKLIPKLRKKGYELVTVSELAKYRGAKMKNDSLYYEF